MSINRSCGMCDVLIYRCCCCFRSKSMSHVCKKGKTRRSEKKGRGGFLFYRLRSKRPELNKREILLIPASWDPPTKRRPGMRFRERVEGAEPASRFTGTSCRSQGGRRLGFWGALSKVARRSERVGQTAYVIQLMMWPAACNL